MTGPAAAVARLYRAFERYPRPVFELCEQCEPEWAADALVAVALGELTLRQLSAAHVMSLDDDGLRYVLPRLFELLLHTSATVFDFRVSVLKTRIADWEAGERDAVRRFAEAVWADLLTQYPADLGYFSDCPSALDLLDWAGIAAGARLDDLLTVEGIAPAAHLADLVDAVFTLRYPFETLTRSTMLAWVERPEVGERLQEVFFLAPGDEHAARISAAHRLWTVCTAGR